MGFIQLAVKWYNEINMQPIINEDDIGVKGVHVISVCSVTDKRAFNLECLLEGVRRKREELMKTGRATAEQLFALHEEYKLYLKQLHDGFLVRQVTVENITTTAGRSVLMARLSGTLTNTGTVNYGALGTGSSTPIIGQTQLDAEVYRKGLSSGTFAANVAYLENFYTSTEVNGSFNEYCFNIDATATVNSGVMFNRFTQAVTKSALETLNVSSSITLASS